MRVIAGSAKGRRLRSLPSRSIRPTTDMVKEALFSTIGPNLPGSRVLDLFAGSGALGIEALSRGAEHVTFVDNRAGAVGIINFNLSNTDLAEKATVLRLSAERFCQAAPQPGERPFSLVLADPPYARGFPADILASLMSAGKLVRDKVVVVVEVSSHAPAPVLPPGYRLDAERRYSDSRLLYLSAAPVGL